MNAPRLSLHRRSARLAFVLTVVALALAGSAAFAAAASRPGHASDATARFQETPDAGDSGIPDPTDAEPRPTEAAVKTTGKTSISFTVFTCPAGYDLFADGANPEKDCPEPAAGVPFSSLGSDTGTLTEKQTNDNGQVTFGNLHPGGHLITETMPEGIGSAFIFSCVSSQSVDADQPFSPLASIDHTGRILVSVHTGEALACTWYNVPDGSGAGANGNGNGGNSGNGGNADNAAGATVTITTLDCPGQTVDKPACKPAPAGIAFALAPRDGSGKPVMAITEKNGVATVQLPPGTYSIGMIEGSFCFAESDAFAADGSLVVADQDIAITIYNCGIG